MRTNLFLSILFSLLLVSLTIAQEYEYEFECGVDFEEDQEEPTSSGYSLYKPCSNGSGEYFRALVVFVQRMGFNP
jgi:hypothetical protein